MNPKQPTTALSRGASVRALWSEMLNQRQCGSHKVKNYVVICDICAGQCGETDHQIKFIDKPSSFLRCT